MNIQKLLVEFNPRLVLDSFDEVRSKSNAITSIPPASPPKQIHRLQLLADVHDALCVAAGRDDQDQLLACLLAAVRVEGAHDHRRADGHLHLAHQPILPAHRQLLRPLQVDAHQPQHPAAAADVRAAQLR